MLRFSIPHVFGTKWKKKLRSTRELLQQIRRDMLSSDDLTATSLMGALDKFIIEDLHLIPENLHLCNEGWDSTDYGNLHAGGTPCGRKFVRLC